MSQLRDIQELMQTLPQEIFDHIYRLTFTASSSAHYAGHPEDPHRPNDAYSDLNLDGFSPALLRRPDFKKLECTFVTSIAAPDTLNLFHVDRSSRTRFGRSYFGGGTFIFGKPNLLAHFLLSMELEFAELVRSVKIPGAKHKIGSFVGTEIFNDWLFYMLEYIPAIY